MERTYLQWNVENWLTVVLMASLGILGVAFISSGVRKILKRGGVSGGDDA